MKLGCGRDEPDVGSQLKVDFPARADESWIERVLQGLRSLGFQADGPAFTIGRPDRATYPMATRAGSPVVAKIYPAGDGEASFDNMQRLWRSSFGERRRPPGLPRPLDYFPNLGVLITERLEGRPFAEFATVDEDTLNASIALVKELHESDVHPRKHREWRRIVRALSRNVERTAERAPASYDSIRRALTILEVTEVVDGELVPCHGDFSPRNVLVGPGGLALIDWDKLQLADPARDIAYTGAWCWAAALRQKRTPDWSVLERVVATYNRLRPGASIEARVRFHVAAGVMRIAHSLVELWPNDAYLVPRLAAEAIRQLR